MSYNTIMVPLDGSTLAQHALPLALSIARRSGAAIHLVQMHVMYPGMYGEGGAAFSILNDDALRHAEEDELRALAERLHQQSNLPVRATLLDTGATAEVLAAHARQKQVDLVVMSTHGRGPLSRFWLGSMTDETIRSAPCPVLAVRPTEAQPDMTLDRVFQRIVVTLDGSTQSEAILEPVVALGALVDARYHLVMVSPETAAAQAYLEKVAGRLATMIARIELHAVTGAYAPTRILELADEVGADLIALETHGRHGFQRWRLGSVADKVLRGATVPVLTDCSVTPTALSEASSTHAVVQL